jgi:Polyketide cyclase / dehydrase and lipid transport
MTNYEYSHTVETTAPTQAVWDLWRDVSRWTEWDSSLESVTLDGPFTAGSSGTMVIPGQPPIAFTLTDVREGAGFTDETSIPGALLRFDHAVEALGEGRARVTHSVVIEGPEAQELGPVVTEDVPEAVAALVKLAEASSAA